MKYESQRVAWWFFATCMLLFALQLVYGLIMAYAHAGHDPLHPIIPFHVARAVHTNLLVDSAEDWKRYMTEEGGIIILPSNVAHAGRKSPKP